MSSYFNNYNSKINNQVVINAGQEKNLVALHEKLDLILERISNDITNRTSEEKVVVDEIQQIRIELAKKSPNLERVESSLSSIGSISSIASLVDQIRPFLKDIF